MVFHALALLATVPENTTAARGFAEGRGACLGRASRENPQHPGAAHYVLHAYDDGVNNRLGLDAARIYAKLAPASSHALHMPSHVFLPLGMWDDAAQVRRGVVCRVGRMGEADRAARWRSRTFTACRGCTTNIFSRAGSRTRAA